MPAVYLKNLSFSYSSAVEIFEEVSVHLSEGWTGVVGANGAGKSTLLSLIVGEMDPSAGRLMLDPTGATVVRCRQEVDVVTPEIRALAEARDGPSRKWTGRMGLDPSGLARWSTLSPGERKRWQLAAALARVPDVLLLDEPTNHIDGEARSVVEAALAGFRGVGLVISHDRSLLDSLTRRTLRVHRGGLSLWEVPYSVALKEWTAEEASLQERYARERGREKALKRRLADERRAAEEKHAKHKRRLRTADPRDHDARSLAAKSRHESGRVAGQRRRTVVKGAMERAGIAAAALAPEKGLGGHIFFDFEPSPKRRLCAFSGPLLAGELTLADHLEAELLRDDRIRLVGPNGVGKTTLLRQLVSGAALPGDRLLYLPQELTREDGTRLLSELASLTPDRMGRVLSVVAALGVDPDQLLMSGRPSPGEARKLALGLGLGVGAWGMILDEPTNHLDLPSVERIESALEAYPGALLIVTHDEAFAARTTSTVWRLESGGLIMAGSPTPRRL